MHWYWLHARPSIHTQTNTHTPPLPQTTYITEHVFVLILYTYWCVRICVRMCVCACVYVCMYVCMCGCVCVLCVGERKHKDVHQKLFATLDKLMRNEDAQEVSLYTDTHTHTHTHTHTQTHRMHSSLALLFFLLLLLLLLSLLSLLLLLLLFYYCVSNAVLTLFITRRPLRRGPHVSHPLLVSELLFLPNFQLEVANSNRLYWQFVKRCNAEKVTYTYFYILLSISTLSVSHTHSIHALSLSLTLSHTHTHGIHKHTIRTIGSLWVWCCVL